MNASLVKFSFYLMLLLFASGIKFEIERQDSKNKGGECKITTNCDGCICGRTSHCTCCDPGVCVCFRIDQSNMTLQILNPDEQLNGPTCKAVGSSSCRRCVCGGKIGPCSCCLNGVCTCYRVDFNQTMAHTDIINY
ncbi:PREDICTED: uncharacterized protein LOC109357178 [Lupinus angustifolius]|uniref:uncharacterized protein LOC109357178 n=1 Tax=Lupinus angustifolius TaxID=3871 RepID=UPI00092F19ED|nr:PREDICTED: uncharacterized protein LOC109357178 [Lupinus angustifolius]